MKLVLAVVLAAQVMGHPEPYEDPELGLTVEAEGTCHGVKRPRFSSRLNEEMPPKRWDGVDRDHIVPWAEALKSGLCSRHRDVQEDFFNDRSNLWYLPSYVNQVEKGDKDFGEWRPRNEANRCKYFHLYLATKQKWHLSVDRTELNQLHHYNDKCHGLG